MIRKLEKLLFEKTEGSQSDILYTQWIYDKKLVPKALSLISSIFPHYSMHDQSHSETIINNIVRLVGIETIQGFTAIDIWFILTSAYYHDIGMAIDAEKLESALKDSTFIEHVLDIKKNKYHYLYSYAQYFNKEGKQLILEKNDFSIDVYDSVKFLLADYFRKFHAKRSEEIIINPMGEISLNSPRGIIPQRIIKILGSICSVHTDEFSKVMDLPIKEVGIDTFDAHPRYIACLLRLGDLLDLDNNRFSDVFLRTIKTIPYDSFLHKNKHFSITHFSVDQTEIDIIAKCDSYDVSMITQHWFSYIRKEVVDQMLNWNSIVPKKEFGYLPTIKNLKVELLDWEYIDEKEKPSFKVDNEKALELLKGAGIYDNSWQCIRELLQNSVDASLVRLWLERDEKVESIFESPINDKFMTEALKYPISVRLTQKGNVNRDEKIQWNILIEDNGIGFSMEDIKHLSLTGSSSKNKTKKQIIESMPVWLRPSGAFGIGFQSVFMITDIVNIETKSFIDQQNLTIELTNPDSKRQGEILIKKKKDTYSIRPGSKLSFDIQTNPVLKKHKQKDKDNNPIYFLRGQIQIDPFEHENLSLEIEYIIKEIQDFAKYNYFNINIFLNEREISEKLVKPQQSFAYFNKQHNIHFDVSFEKKDEYFRTNMYYKNQEVFTRYIDFDYINLDVNILKSNAKEIVSLNRNHLLPSFEREGFEEVLQDCIFEIIPSYFIKNKLNDIQEQHLSMFVNYYWNDKYNKYLKKEDYQQWKNYELLVDTTKISISNIISKVERIKIIERLEFTESAKDEYKIEENTFVVIEGDCYDEIRRFIYFIIQDIFPEIQEEYTEGFKERIFIRSTSESELFEEQRIISYIKGEDLFDDNGEFRIGRGREGREGRYLIPCAKKYSNLQIKNEELLNFVDTEYISNSISKKYPKMISPYLIKIKKNQFPRKTFVEKKITSLLYDWVYQNRFDEKVTKEEIIKTYEEFVAYFDNKILTNTEDKTLKLKS